MVGKTAERKKVTRWTGEEHRRFLMGLVRFRKGDWKSISRFVVITRTPTQVASHAQKFFLRHNNSTKKDTKRKRSRNSILDINFSFSDFPNINNVQDQQTSPLLDNFSFSDFPNINNVQDQQTSPLLGNFSFSDFPNINNVQDQQTSPLLDNFSFSDFPNINTVQDQQTSPLLDNFSFSDFPKINNVQDQQTSPLLDNFSFSDLPADFLDDQQIDHVMDIQDNFLFSDDINTTLNNFPNYPPNFLDQQTQDVTIPMDWNFPNHPTNFPDQQAQGGGIWYSTDYIDEPAQLDHQGGEIGYFKSYLDQKIQLAQEGGIGYSTNHLDEQVQSAQGGGVGYLTNFPDWQTGWEAFTQQEDGFQDFNLPTISQDES